MQKSKVIVIAYVIVSLLLMLMDWVRFDVSLAMDNIGFDLFWGFALIILIVVYIMLMIFSVVYFIKQKKEGLFRALLPFALMVIVFMYYAFVNYSDIYMDINYSLNKSNREKIIEMYKNDELSQININRYLVHYRLASHNKKVYIQTKGDVIKAIFYISNGITQDRIVLYSSDENAVFLNDFGESSPYWDLQNIRKVSSNWFFAELKK